MLIKVVKGFLLFFIFFCIFSCSKVYIKEEKEFFKGQSYQITELPPDCFSVCATLFSNNSLIYTTAEVYCLKQNKKCQLLRKTYFTSCSLTNPVAYIFKCVPQ